MPTFSTVEIPPFELSFNANFNDSLGRKLCGAKRAMSWTTMLSELSKTASRALHRQMLSSMGTRHLVGGGARSPSNDGRDDDPPDSSTDKRRRQQPTTTRRPLEPIRGELVYGLHPCTAVLQARRRSVTRLYVQDTKLRDSKMRSIVDTCRQRDIPILSHEHAWLDCFAQTSTHQGVCLDCAMWRPDAFTAKQVPEARGEQLWLLLDSLTDTHNIGAVLRSASYFGVERVLMSETRASPVSSPVVAKASAGATELVDVQILPDLETRKVLARFRQRGWNVVAAVSSSEAMAMEKPNAQQLDAYRWRGSTLVVLGNESDGVRPDIVKELSDAITIAPPPALGDEARLGVTSLNVSVSAGIVLHTLSLLRKFVVFDSESEDTTVEEEGRGNVL